MESIPLPYVRIWCKKNNLWVGFQTPNGDLYRVDSRGVYLSLPDRSLSLVNPRLVFPVVDRHPSLTSSQIMMPPGGGAVALNACSDDHSVQTRRVGFQQIRDEVESYLSLLTHLDPVQFYVAIRLYESGAVSLPHLTRITSNLNPGTTLGTELIREHLTNWEDMLAVSMDVPFNPRGIHAGPQAPEYELIGEILVSLGRLTRTQLHKALNTKKGGDKPLGELLVQMGACSKSDIENCLRAQQKILSAVEDRVGLLGELLVQHGTVTYDDLEDALRMQRIGRQPLQTVLISMGVITEEDIAKFVAMYPQYISEQGIDERAFGQALMHHKIATNKQLEEARRVQSRGRLMLGELLVNMGKCKQEDIDRVLGAQQNMRQQASDVPKKLGEILVQQQIVPPNKVEEAARMQKFSRQKMGATLLSLGECNEQDFTDALELQFSWRQTKDEANDRLGIELLNRGEVSAPKLETALEIQARAGKPLGAVLVETGTCTPESVIDTLIQREERRRKKFDEYIKGYNSGTFRAAAPSRA